MHILLAILGSTVGLIWGLNRLQNSGVDLNSFNPFLWARRRKWANELGTLPIHRLENPIEAASLFLVAVAEMKGETTREQKAEIFKLFEDEFEVSESDAAEAYRSSSFLLRDVTNITNEVGKVLAPNLDKFNPHHRKLLLEMLNKVARMESNITSEQTALIAKISREFEKE